MAFKSSMLVLFVAMALCATCSGAGVGAAYKVGGPRGWMIGPDYHQWSSSKEFHVGDTLLFSYSSYHNVFEVTEEGYKSCDPSSPIAVYSSGSDTITLKRFGHYYFLCGIPGHCADGQKVEVVVSSLPTAVDSPAISPSPVPSGSSSPSSTPNSAPFASSTPATPSPTPSSSTLHPQERLPHSAASTTIDAPKLIALATVFISVSFFLGLGFEFLLM